MEKLIIIGDSWSCGEWQVCDDRSIKLVHPGMTEYLPYHTVNLSACAASNWDTLHSLISYCHQMQGLDQSFSVIVFQVNPVRLSNIEKFYDTDFKELINQTDSYEQLYTDLTEIFYMKLSNVTKHYNVPVYIIGGCSDVNVDLYSEYNDKESIICQSWIKLLYEKHIPSVIPMSMETQMLTRFKKLGRIDLFDQMLETWDKNFTTFNEMLNLETFGPSLGDYHPSRLGHKVIAETIIDFIDKQKKG